MHNINIMSHTTILLAGFGVCIATASECSFVLPLGDEKVVGNLDKYKCNQPTDTIRMADFSL